MDTSFWNRLEHIWHLIKPTNLFITDSQLAVSKGIVDNPPNGITREELNHHRSIVGSVLHPDTGEKIFLPFRMSCFVPTNLVVTAGLLIPNPSLSTLLFWQISNQSINVGFNIANANKSHPISIIDTLKAYGLAVLLSCSVANGMNHLGKRPGISSWVTRLAPFAAVSAANIANVYATRWHEMKHGIAVTDESGSIKYGMSTVAAKNAIAQTTVSRIATAFPVLVLAPLIMNRLERTSIFKSFPKLWIPTQLSVIGFLMMTALPCALAIFPPRGKMSIKDLEPTLLQHLPESIKPNTLNTEFLYFNKGL
jgi:tricarboxylate carrier